MLLIEDVLGWTRQRLPGGRLNTVVTALLLKADGTEAQFALDGLARGRYRIDVVFFEALFDATRSKVARLQLAKSLAFPCLPKTTFRRLYLRLWRSRDSTDAWRHALAWSLLVFLRRNPDQGSQYASVISRQMRDGVEEIALLGVSAAGFLGKALSVADAEHLCLHLERRSLKTMNVLNALTEVYTHWTVTPEPVRRLLTSQAVTRRIEQLGKDDSFKSNALYCARAMKAVGRNASSPEVIRTDRSTRRGH